MKLCLCGIAWCCGVVPVEIPDYQVTPELIDKLNDYLEVFKGTNNFFNYTIRMDKNDASAKRYIIGFKVSSRPSLSALCPLHLFQGCNTHARVAVH